MRKRRDLLFTKEKQRQASLVARVEKIQVNHIGVPEQCELLMNKNLSTPYHCAMRKLFLMHLPCSTCLAEWLIWSYAEFICFVIVFNRSRLQICCIADIQEALRTRSVLALVNDQPWDMHRPLSQDCTLEYLHFKDANPYLANTVHIHVHCYLMIDAFTKTINASIISWTAAIRELFASFS